MESEKAVPTDVIMYVDEIFDYLRQTEVVFILFNFTIRQNIFANQSIC